MLRWAVPDHEVDGPSTPGGHITVTADRTSTGGTRREVQFVKSNPMTAGERATKKRRLQALFPKIQAAARAADAKRKREATPDEADLAACRTKKAAADKARLQREREVKAAVLASMAAARMSGAAAAAVPRPQPRLPPQQNPAAAAAGELWLPTGRGNERSTLPEGQRWHHQVGHGWTVQYCHNGQRLNAMQLQAEHEAERSRESHGEQDQPAGDVAACNQ